MFVLIWAALLFSVRGSNADTGGSVEERTRCNNGLCITLNEGEITAEAGLCVVIPCSFTRSEFTPEHMIWYKCEPYRRCGDSDVIFHTDKNSKKVQPQFEGRVSLLQSDVSRNNCSIIINDLTVSDSGSYQLRVNGFWWKWSGGYYKVPEGLSFSARPTVSVKDLIQKPTVMIPPLTEGQQSTLTCTAPGHCSGSDPTITWRWKGTGVNDSHITGNITAENHSSTLTFNPLAELHGTGVTCKVSFAGDTTTEETVTLNVTYVKEIKITGNTSVTEGETLNLTCSVESFPPSLITWTKLSDKNVQNGTEINLQNKTLTDLRNDTETFLQVDRGMSTFSIYNMTVENSGEYICTAKHLNNSLIKKVDVTVKLFPRILKNSGCKVQSEVLTCVCISEGIPLPTIKWPLLKNHTEYSVITTVSKHTVSCTVTLTVKEHSNTSAECVSSNELGEVKQNFTIQVDMPKLEADQPGPCAVLPWVIAAVLSLSVNVIFIVCLVFLWNTRKKVKPNQEDRTYMSLRRNDLSPEYDVIGQPLN